MRKLVSSGGVAKRLSTPAAARVLIAGITGVVAAPTHNGYCRNLERQKEISI
jgi:hypothetical protein